MRQKLESGLVDLRWLLVLGVIALFAFHWATVARTAVDVPYWDEWEALRPEALPNGLTWSWLTARHTDNRMLLTNLQIWVLYKAGGWNVALQQVLNFGLFGLLLAGLGLWARRNVEGLGPGTIAFFLAFTLSPLLYESHSMGGQSCFHLSLLFFMLAVLSLLQDDLPPRRLAAGIAFAWLSMNSHASGLSFCGALVLCFSLFKLSRLLGTNDPSLRRMHVMHLAAALAVVGLGVWLWSRGYQRHPDYPDMAWPYGLAFWRFYANLVSLGFGMDQLSMTLGLLCVAAAAAPVSLVFARKGPAVGVPFWRVSTMIVGILTCLAVIAAARAGLGLDWSKTSRYFEFSVMLVPLSAMAWSMALREARSRRLALGLLAAFCLLGFANNWDFSVYSLIASHRRAGLACLAEAMRGGPDLCKEVYPWPLGDKLERAKALKLSFTRGPRR